MCNSAASNCAYEGRKCAMTYSGRLRWVPSTAARKKNRATIERMWREMGKEARLTNSGPLNGRGSKCGGSMAEGKKGVNSLGR